MANWRRRRYSGEFHNQEVHRVRSDYRRPSQEIWKSTVPSWEKRFCSSVGTISWSKFVDNKRYVHLFTKILEWDDSAGEEAFNNAKSRFWATINHLPCDIPFPDPNTNIDSVDWNAAVDPNLYLEVALEKERKPLEEDTANVFFCEALLLDPKFTSTGWGDEEDANPQVNDWENQVIVADCQTGWGDHSNGWGNDFNRQDDSRNKLGADNSGWGNDGSGWNESKHVGPRFPANNHGFRGDRGYRGRRKNVNVAHQKHPLRQWNMKPCAQPS